MKETPDKTPTILKSKDYINGKYCVYLDQFAFSNLFDNIHEWSNLKKLIERGVKNGKIVCPLSVEHLIETSGKTDSAASEQFEYIKSLAGGYIFKPEPFITAQLLISWVRKNNLTQNTFFEKNANLSFSLAEFIGRLRSRNQEFVSMIREATSLSNKIRDIGRSQNITSSEQVKLMEVIKATNVRQFTDRLEQLIAHGGIMIRAVKFESRAVPHSVDYILDILMKRSKITKAEASLLLSALQIHGFNQVSTLNTRYTLHAHICVKQKKQTSNDELDISRIASAIQVSDIMVIDKARKFEVNETQLNKKYGAYVFCGVKEDINKLCTLLKTVID